jgi:hypothetical protein
VNFHSDSKQPFALVFDFSALLVDNLNWNSYIPHETDMSDSKCTYVYTYRASLIRRMSLNLSPTSSIIRGDFHCLSTIVQQAVVNKLLLDSERKKYANSFHNMQVVSGK